MTPGLAHELQTTSFPIPAEDVGRLIGKHGVQIKSIREQSRCQITVDSNDKEKQPHVTLKGTPNNILVARRLISGVIGGQGVVYLRDIDESKVLVLTRDRWLQEKSAEFGVTAQSKGRHIKIVVDDVNKDLDAAQKFKDLVERRISGHGETDVEESVPVEPMDVLPRASGTSSKEFIRLHAKLFERCTPTKLNDLRSDVADAVEQRFKVKVELTPGATQAVIEGGHESAVYKAKEELELILQYYFIEDCAVVPVPIAAISEICGEKEEKLARYQNGQLQVTVDRNAGRLWICGLPKPAENAFQKLRTDVDEWIRRQPHGTC